MKKESVGTFLATFGLCAVTAAFGQGTFISNLDRPTTGSLPVASDAWLATWFRAGTAPNGYSLDSIQLSMSAPSGTPGGFTVLLWDFQFDQSIALLLGPTPSSSGVYTFVAPPSFTLSASQVYWFVVTATTPIAAGAFQWEHSATGNDIIGIENWRLGAAYQTSPNGIDWDRSTHVGNLKFAVNATAIPEPSALVLSGLGSLLLAKPRHGNSDNQHKSDRLATRGEDNGELGSQCCTK